MQIREIENTDELSAAYDVFHELRTHLSLDDFKVIYREAKERDSYTVVIAIDGSKVIAAMGYRLLFDLVHGKHLYIDDLVTTKNERSHGIGAKLLQYAEEIARTESCSGLRLCTGTENASARKFYERENWAQRSVVYKKKL
jgi:GNAT superfamily N-acetyltransferase